MYYIKIQNKHQAGLDQSSIMFSSFIIYQHNILKHIYVLECNDDANKVYCVIVYYILYKNTEQMNFQR